MARAGTDGRASSPAPGQIAAWATLLIAVFWVSVRGWGALQVGVSQDDANYIVLARSLAFGDEYGFINQPGPAPPTKYGFTFPLMLAVVVRLFPDNLDATTAVPLAATLINLSLLFWGWPLLSPGASRWWGLAVASLHGLSPMAIGHSRMAMSEPVFTMFALASLVLIETSVRRRARVAISLGLGVILTLAFYTRPIGIALWMAALARLGLAGRWRAIGGVVAASVALLTLVVAATPVELVDLPPSGYAAELRAGRGRPSPRHGGADSFAEQSRNVAAQYVLAGIRDATIPVGGGQREVELANQLGIPLAPYVFAAIVTALVALGAWVSFAYSALAPTVLGFQALYMGSLLAWPWPSARFLYPVQPLLLLELLLGIAWLTGRILRWRREENLTFGAGAYAAAAVWVALIVPSLGKGLAVTDSRQFVRNLEVGPDWLAANTQADAVIMARYPHSIYLYSKRKTVDLIHPPSAAEFELLLRDLSVDYVLFGPELRWGGDRRRELDSRDAALLHLCDELATSGHMQRVYESAPRDGVVIYRVKRS